VEWRSTGRAGLLAPRVAIGPNCRLHPVGEYVAGEACWFDSNHRYWKENMPMIRLKPWESYAFRHTDKDGRHFNENKLGCHGVEGWPSYTAWALLNMFFHCDPCASMVKTFRTVGRIVGGIHNDKD
jgi:hypothetical protein